MMLASRCLTLCLSLLCYLHCDAFLARPVAVAQQSQARRGCSRSKDATAEETPTHILVTSPAIAGHLPNAAFFKAVAEIARVVRRSEIILEIVVVQTSPSDASDDYLRVVLGALDIPPEISTVPNLAEGAARLTSTCTPWLLGIVGFGPEGVATVQGEIFSRGHFVRTQRLDSESGAPRSGELPALGEPSEAGAQGREDKVAIVLGNMPLDATTITMDSLARVRQAVAYVLGVSASSVSIGDRDPVEVKSGWPSVVFSGGRTASYISEALQMALVAVSMGLPLASVALEEHSLSTEQNALFVAQILKERLDQGLVKEGSLSVSVVSKQDHLSWALPIFQRVGREQGLECLLNAVALPAPVRPDVVITQMEKFLSRMDVDEDAKSVVRLRRDNLIKGIRGID